MIYQFSSVVGEGFIVFGDDFGKRCLEAFHHA